MTQGNIQGKSRKLYLGHKRPEWRLTDNLRFVEGLFVESLGKHFNPFEIAPIYKRNSKICEILDQTEETMIDLPLDEDGYPTEEALKTIEEFKDWHKLENLFAAIKNVWAYPDYFSGPLDEPPKEVLPLLWREPKSKWYRLGTAGWSGNEMIIAALEKNPIIQSLFWYMSARGGLHVYQLRIPENP